MPERLTFSGVPEPIEVDLLDHEFESAPITRAVQRKSGPLSEKLLAAMFETDEDGKPIEENDDWVARENPDSDLIIDVLAKLLDLRLRSTNGSSTKPSTLINRKWKGDELDFRALFGFWNEFRAAEAPPPVVPEPDADRPT